MQRRLESAPFGLSIYISDICACTWYTVRLVKLPTDIAGSVCGQPIRKSWQNHDITSMHEPCRLDTAILHNLGHDESNLATPLVLPSDKDSLAPINAAKLQRVQRAPMVPLRSRGGDKPVFAQIVCSCRADHDSVTKEHNS
jgi:hypothetical protein